jgi:hypothetical protein
MVKNPLKQESAMDMQKMTKAQLIQEIEALQKKMEKQDLSKNGGVASSEKVLEGINEVFRIALSCPTIESLALKSLNIAERITGSHFGFIGEVNPSGRLDTLALSDPGWGDCRIPKSDAPVMINNMELRGLWSIPLKTRKSLIVNNPAGQHPGSVGIPEGHPPLTALLCVPLLQGTAAFGVIALGNKPGGYSDEDQKGVEAIAMAVGEAIVKKNGPRWHWKSRPRRCSRSRFPSWLCGKGSWRFR